MKKRIFANRFIAIGIAALLASQVVSTSVTVFATSNTTQNEQTTQERSQSNYDVVKDANKLYLSDRDPNGSQSSSIRKDVNNSGGVISLLDNGVEKTYEKGLSTHAYSSLYYTDIQEYGYTKFTADVGLASSVRNQTSNNYATVTFKVFADGQEVFNSGEMNATSNLKHVDVDLTGVQVLQLVVEPGVNNSYDHATWANAAFEKDNKNSPWLEVNDLEFNLPEQVTDSNILEYADAKDHNGVDISDNITYTTNYVSGKTGDFTVTYTVTDSEGNQRTRTVKMTVTGEDYSGQLPLERLKQPWASYLYHGRGTLPTQGQKAWDLILAQILNFDRTKWQKTTHYGESVYAITVNLPQNGIYATKGEVDKLQVMMMDDEPRTFILPDWSNDVTTKDGIAETVTIYARANLAENQDSWLQKIENNTVSMLSEAKHDMDEAQKVYYVLSKYAKWLQYGAGGQLLHESLGNGIAVCGGNARGTVYLTSRLGVKSIFGRSGSHAWSYTKLSNEDSWFKNDLLAGPAILVDANSSKHNLQVGGNYLTRHYEWFDFSTKDYDRSKLQYPSIWLNLSTTNVLLLKGQSYNLYDYVSSFGSVFTEGISQDDIDITINKIDSEGNVYAGIKNTITPQGDGTNLQGGTYLVRYTLVDGQNVATKTLNLQVTSGESDRKYFNDKSSSTGNMNSIDRVGLYTGSGEKYYENALYSNEAGSITFDVSDNNYKYVTMDFGIKDSVRQNTQWGSNGKVKLEVVADGTVVYTSQTLGWKDHYESVVSEIPQGTQQVTLKIVPMGAGNNHAAIGNLCFAEDTGVSEGLEQYTTGLKLTGNAVKAGSSNLYDGQKEVLFGESYQIPESGSILIDVSGKNYPYVAFNFGIKGSVRENTQWGHYGKANVEVIVDGSVIYTGDVLGWKDAYQDIKVALPQNAQTVTIKNVPKGAGNNHVAITDLRFLSTLNGSDGAGDYASTVYKTGNMTTANTVGLYNGKEEVYYENALVSQEAGSITLDIQDKNYTSMTLDFGIKDSVRQNTQWGHYGKVQLQVIIDGKNYYTSKVLGWKDAYQSVNIEIPQGARTITLVNVPKGSGNNHAAIGNLQFS